MLKSSFLNQKRWLWAAIVGAGAVLGLGFTGLDKWEAIYFCSKAVYEAIDNSHEVRLKKWDFTLPDGNYIRLRKTYLNGKQEYFSLNLHRLSAVDYQGTADAGILSLRTQADDIIVQTYNDPAGNIDSMATVLSFPVKNLANTRLDSLRNALLFLKQQ